MNHVVSGVRGAVASPGASLFAGGDAGPGGEGAPRRGAARWSKARRFFFVFRPQSLSMCCTRAFPVRGLSCWNRTFHVFSNETKQTRHILLHARLLHLKSPGSLLNRASNSCRVGKNNEQQQEQQQQQQQQPAVVIPADEDFIERQERLLSAAYGVSLRDPKRQRKRKAAPDPVASQVFLAFPPNQLFISFRLTQLFSPSLPLPTIGAPLVDLYSAPSALWRCVSVDYAPFLHASSHALH